MKELKILLPTTRLDIGGAETHVLGLAKQLKRMGHYPIIISSGGVYVEELKREGIPHHYVPLDDKRCTDLLESFKIFGGIIKEEKIDIIHTHGRIASLISKTASIVYKVPFMTTAHALFSHGGGLKYLTFWGDEVIAISEDVKQHLMDKFGVGEEKITIIENGIDTYAFNTYSNNMNLIEELGLDRDSIKILYISRLSGTLADLAVRIIKSFPELSRKLDKVELLIVGDGDDYEQVRGVHRQIDPMKKSIKLLGKRTDIPEIMNSADVVVAVGRTALEAMAVKKPVILAGGEGYLGLLCPQNYDLAKSTNFTGRNIGHLYTEERFINEVVRLFSVLSEEERETLGEFGRKKVEEQFSIKRMTEKTVKIYEKLLRNWGHFNEDN